MHIKLGMAAVSGRWTFDEHYCWTVRLQSSLCLNPLVAMKRSEK